MRSVLGLDNLTLLENALCLVFSDTKHMPQRGMGLTNLTMNTSVTNDVPDALALRSTTASNSNLEDSL